MLQQQQQVRSIIKFNAPHPSGQDTRHQYNSGNGDNSKVQKNQNGRRGNFSSWKANSSEKAMTNNTSQQTNKAIVSPTSSQDSLSSIWLTPPLSHSPASLNGEFLTSTPLKAEGTKPSLAGRMIRAQDLSCGTNEASIWSSSPQDTLAAKDRFPSNVTAVGGWSLANEVAPNKDSNACLQLFSENFLSYLNMIN